jgi:hypothetical protein
MSAHGSEPVVPVDPVSTAVVDEPVPAVVDVSAAVDPVSESMAPASSPHPDNASQARHERISERQEPRR